MNGRRSLRAAIIAATLGVGIGVVPAFAHHSFGLYDMGRTAEIDGTVVQMEWSNPHCWLFVRVGTSSGAHQPEMECKFFQKCHRIPS